MQTLKDPVFRNYVMVYSTIYIGLTLLTRLIIIFFSLDIGLLGTLMALILSASFTIRWFVEKEKRPPFDREKNKLVLYCLLSNTIMIFLGLASIYFFDVKTFRMFTSITPIILIGMLVIYVFVSYLIFNYIFGSVAKKIHESRKRKAIKKNRAK